MSMKHNKNFMHNLLWSLVILFYKGQGLVTIYQGWPQDTQQLLGWVFTNIHRVYLTHNG